MQGQDQNIPKSGCETNMNLSFQLVDTASPRPLSVELDSLVIVGWAGRDLVAIEKHVAELAALGVGRPSAIPLYYRVAVTQLTQAPRIQVLGAHTSGEAEVFLFQTAGELFVSLVSDHTDRQVEAQGVALSKQVCAKPVGSSAWRYADVEGHWDDLILRSSIEEGDATTVYQEGSLAELKPASDLLAGYRRSMGLLGTELPDRAAMSCGTLAAIGGIRPARSFAMELIDPHRRCSLRHDYSIEVLPVVA